MSDNAVLPDVSHLAACSGFGEFSAVAGCGVGVTCATQPQACFHRIIPLPACRLGPVGIHRELMTAAAR